MREEPDAFMSYFATVLKVMIASPTDVQQERSIAREVIHEWNAVNSEHNRVVLLPVGWETHAAPSLGERPQELINKQVLRTCDLLVAMFWTRLGTSTGVAESGTVEEIKEHLAANKTAMLYFSTARADLALVDQDQYNQLNTFKDSIRQIGIVEEYGSAADFGNKFGRQLAQTINDNLSHMGNTEEEVRVSSARGYDATDALDDEATRLLRAAAEMSDGTVRIVRTLEGLHVQAGREAFCEPGNARSEARCQRIIKELESLGYLEDRTGRGEILYVTDRGFSLADSLGNSQERGR